MARTRAGLRRTAALAVAGDGAGGSAAESAAQGGIPDSSRLHRRALDEASRWRRAVLAVAGEKERTNARPKLTPHLKILYFII